jgi:hypothetical protein
MKTKQCKYFVVLLMVLLLSSSRYIIAQTFTTHTYSQDLTNFANPERGFYKHTETSSTNYSSLSESTLRGYRSQGIVLIIRVFYLENFLLTPISTAYLNNVENDFNTARRAGVKIIVRFAYTKKSSPPYGDATPDRVLQHIEQLGPLLKQNSDVIALVQAGFIGAWGEWYYTDHFSQTLGNPTEADWVNRRKVVNALMAALPANRMVQVRTPNIKRKLMETNGALTSGEAFAGTTKSRMAHHNDCFLASPDDYGTYINITEEKQYLETETTFLAMGGETCGPFVPLSECPNALAEMKRFHWSYLNRDYHPTVLNGWNTNGCMDEVERQLGYRYRLTKTTLQNESKPGGGVTLSIHLVNDGWANPFNPRPVEVVLKNPTTEKEYRLLTAEDPRRWSLSDTIKIELTAGLQVDVEQGSYEISIHLPDPEVQLRKSSDYSIRFANTNVWQSTSGFNRLGHTLVVSSTATVSGYNGTSFFLPVENPVTLGPPPQLLGSSYGNNILLYWGLTIDNYHRTIERSSNGNDFAVIATLAPGVFSYVDKSLTTSTSYTYRSRVTDGGQLSDYTNSLSLQTQASQPPYYNFTTDGLSQDWEAVKPLASVFSQGSTHAFRLSADKDSLNILFEGGTYTLQRIYLDTDNNPLTGINMPAWQSNGFDYRVSNDSVFAAQAGSWIFIEKTKSKRQAAYTEVSVRLGALTNLNQNLLIRTAAEVKPEGQNKIYLPFQGESAVSFVRALPPAVINSFSVSNSTNLPETQLIVSWQACSGCLGYVLERSTQADADFEPIATLTRLNFIFYDNNLITGTTYYYRAFAYNDAGLSQSTVTLSGTPQVVTGIEDPAASLVKIYPNPTSNYFYVSKPEDELQVSLFDLAGRKIHVSKMNEKGGTIQFDVSNLASGLYLVTAIDSSGRSFHHRLIRQ